MSERLATVAGTVSDVQFAVRKTALAADERLGTIFDNTLLRVADGLLDTPAGSPADPPAVYTTFDDTFFDRISVTTAEPVRSLVRLHDLQQWIDQLSTADEIAMEFYGDRGTGVTDRLVLETDVGSVTLDGIGSAETLSEVPTAMPRSFEGNQFEMPDGTPASTVIRTTGTTLERVADIVETLEYPSYPIHADNDGPFLDIEWEDVHVETRLPGALVDGEPVYNDYDDGFAPTARALNGQIHIETGVGMPAAFVRRGEGYTLRVVLGRV
jgi:hypothetical protein